MLVSDAPDIDPTKPTALVLAVRRVPCPDACSPFFCLYQSSDACIASRVSSLSALLYFVCCSIWSQPGGDKRNRVVSDFGAIRTGGWHQEPTAFEAPHSRSVSWPATQSDDALSVSPSCLAGLTCTLHRRCLLGSCRPAQWAAVCCAGA
jgi:hypothetical protein